MKLKKYNKNYNKGCIYFLYSKGILVYIGKTSELKKRIYSHRFSLNFTYDNVYYYPLDSDSERHVLERRLIKQIQPPQNIKDNPKYYHLHPFYRKMYLQNSLTTYIQKS